MKSFLSGKKDHGNLSIATAAPALSVSRAPSLHSVQRVEGTASAAIEVVKEGSKVVRLVITCACGERMEVECLYPAGV